MVSLLVAFLAATTTLQSAPAANPLPGVGESIVLRDVKVTLLGARRMSVDECRDAFRSDLLLWAGGGVRAAFLVENRPGAVAPPTLNDVRVLLGTQIYNEVTTATSGRPFAPLAIVRSIDEFAATGYGRELKTVPKARPTSPAAILELFIRGGPIPAGAEAVLELSDGDAHPDPLAFRFRVAALD